MASKKILHMQFQSEDGRKISMALPYIKDDLKEEEVKSTMDLITAKNIFTTKGGELKKALGATITTTDIEKMKF